MIIIDLDLLTGPILKSSPNGARFRDIQALDDLDTKDFKWSKSVIFQGDPHFCEDYDVSTFQNIALKI